MSVSSHLTPQPEQRLWVLLEHLRREAEGAELRLAGLAFLSVFELSWLAPGRWASAALLAAILAALAGWAPFGRRRRWLDPDAEKPRAEDILLTAPELIRYSRGELALKLDKYFGGGIATTPYYEDLVGLSLDQARATARKQRLLRLALALAALAQASLLLRLAL